MTKDEGGKSGGGGGGQGSLRVRARRGKTDRYGAGKKLLRRLYSASKRGGKGSGSGGGAKYHHGRGGGINITTKTYSQRVTVKARIVSPMARPRKHVAGLAKAISFRLSSEDYATWQEKVQASGLSASEFFRDAVLTNRTQVVARAAPSRDYDRLLYLFNKAGNNLNQLVHRVHTEHLAGTVSEATAAGVLSELQRLTRYMRAALQDA